jgi:anti-sigma regulatory factor (Ser/Thr protein kinase)
MSTTALTQHARDIIATTFADLGAGELIGASAFTASANQVARARRFVHDHLADHPARDTALLLVSELATNSIRHSHSAFFAVIITRTPAGHLRIAIIDEGHTGIPHLQDPATDAEDGRGMTIVDLLATRWGIIRLPGVGTAVWFE